MHAKNSFVIMFLAPNFHIEKTSIVSKFITFLCLCNFVDMMQSMNGIVC